MFKISILVTTKKLYLKAVEEYGCQVADLMWAYCELVRKQCKISNSTPHTRRKRQREACLRILKDVVEYGDPRSGSDVVVGGSDGYPTDSKLWKRRDVFSFDGAHADSSGIQSGGINMARFVEWTKEREERLRMGRWE